MDENLRELSRQAAEEPTRASGAANAPETESGAGWLSEKSFGGSAYDPRGIEQWLADRAADGDELVDWNRFRAGEPREQRFYLEPAAEKAAPDEALRAKRALLGWGYVCTTKNGIFHVWRGDRTAHVPMLRECADSYAYRTVRKKLRQSYFLPTIYALGILALLYFMLFRAWTLPVLALLIMSRGTLLQFVSLILSGVSGMFSNAQEQKELRMLKQAMEQGEPVGEMKANRRRKAAIVIALVSAGISFALIWRSDASVLRDEGCGVPRQPYITAAQLGGETVESYLVREVHAPLIGSIRSTGEEPYVTSVDNWSQYSTELDFYELKLTTLAAPLAHELRDYFMTEQFAQPLTLDGFDEAYYFAEAPGSGRLYYKEGIPTKGWEPQFLILRRGGCVLFYRAETPESLLDHLDEFAEIFKRYSEK